MAHADRRGFFKELLGAGAELVQEVGVAFRGALEPEFSASEPVERIVRAGPVRRIASLGDFERLVDETGLAERYRVAARRLARTGFRLVPDPTGTSYLGGIPALPDALEWPRRDGRALAFLGQISLGEAAGLGLPQLGSLLFFYDVEGQPDGLRPGDDAACRVFLLEHDQRLAPRDETAVPPATRVGLSSELMLPPAYSAHVDPFDFDVEAFEAWSRLRERLAEFQGVPLDDQSGDFIAVHRLLGYAEPVYGREMELDCELVADGLDLSEGEGYFDPRRDELEPGAADWRLLLQLSVDPDLGLAWRDPFRRLYLWIREQDLLACDFRRVRPMLQ